MGKIWSGPDWRLVLGKKIIEAYQDFVRRNAELRQINATYEAMMAKKPGKVRGEA